MRALAQAVISAAAFIGLSSDDIIDPDAAVRALEDIGAILSACTVEERTVLRQLLVEAREQAIFKGQSAEMIEFYDNFFDNFLRETAKLDR